MAKKKRVFSSQSSEPVPSPPYNTTRSLTAAATRITSGDKASADQFKRRKNSPTEAWQNEAWEYYDAIGEIKYAFNLVASVVSRIRLYAAVVTDASQTPVSVRESENIDSELGAAAERALARLDSAYGGQAGLLKDAALNLSIAGECYLVNVPAYHDPNNYSRIVPESWDIRSVDELQVNAQGKYVIVPRRDLLQTAGMSISAKTSGVTILPDDAFKGRIWKAHPRFSEEPESSLRGLLDLCSELLLLGRLFRSTEKSRLNAGALFIPDGMSVAAQADPDYPYDEGEGEELGDQTAEEAADEFEEQLLDAMITPISDEESANAVVPLLIRGPVELGQHIKLTKFERAFDDTMVKRSDRVLERILQGLDVPKDIVTGLASVKYSNAIQIDESLYKAHIEPLLLLISDSITQIYLRPYLRSLSYSEEEISKIVVWYDPSAVATRNDRAADADSGYEKMAISSATWRRAHGFSDADAPEPKEVILRMLMDKASFSPELTEGLFAAIAPDLMAAVRTAAQQSSAAPIPPEVQNALSGQPTPEAPPEGEAPADAGLIEPGATPAGGETLPADTSGATEQPSSPLSPPSSEDNTPL